MGSGRAVFNDCGGARLVRKNQACVRCRSVKNYELIRKAADSVKTRGGHDFDNLWPDAQELATAMLTWAAEMEEPTD